MIYKVRKVLINKQPKMYLKDTYEVYNIVTGECEHEGSLADCLAYLELKESGRM